MAWRGLSDVTTGRVFRPDDPGYRTHTSLFNKRFEGRHRPLGVLVVADVEDVRRALAWAREQQVTPVVRAGGHSFAGYSVNDGLVIDLSRLSLARADGSTGLVTVGGGARLGQVYDAVRPYEMAFSAGTNPLVGVGGLVLGGGCEYASRRFGLTTDALVETVVVTAEGAVLTCNDRENADLFWACRGGGGGNFGVNVSFTFQAQPVPDVTTFSLSWAWADTAKVVEVLQQVLWQAPDEFAVRIGLSTHGATPSSIGENLTVTAAGQFLGPVSGLMPLLDPVLTVATPTGREVLERTYWDARGAMTHATSADEFALRTRYVKTPVSGDGIAAMMSWVERWPGSSNPDGGGIGLFSWGGAINRTPADATAFVHRDTMFLASMDTSWTDADPAGLSETNLRWLDGMYEAMAGHLSDSSYQNFVDPALDTWRQAYYGDNYSRLVEVKNRYDPDGLFQFEQAVGC
ncbi:oxidoreductase [Micromonospora rosaria]|uniref:Oxidoreductase n=1 Tax=Micromonospora rosaria TaxID=47874 RepID=A0A136PVD4_9ACTN|nr:oxidoreductase [Micromonospora rosaria]